jgi:exopolysaccharide production negative regulator
MNPIKMAIKIANIVAAIVCVGWSIILFDSYREPLKAQLLPDNPPLGINAFSHAGGDFEPLCQLMLKCPPQSEGDELRAFNYFSQIANSYPDEAPGTPQAQLVANAFVALGRYYLSGIPNSKIASDRARARDMFGYAATYFGDAEAQYELGRLYLTGTPGDPYQAARWLQLAARKGHCRAEVALGDLLFPGTGRATAGGTRTDVAEARP